MEFQLGYFKSWKMMRWKCCTQYASKFGKLSSGHRTGKWLDHPQDWIHFNPKERQSQRTFKPPPPTHLSDSGIRGRGPAVEFGLTTYRVVCVCACACCAQSHPILGDPVDCNPPDASVHGPSRARILEWVAISSFRGPSWSRNLNHVSCLSCFGKWVLHLEMTSNPIGWGLHPERLPLPTLQMPVISPSWWLLVPLTCWL